MSINPFWNDYYKTISYTEEYFKDKEQVSFWKECGHNVDYTTIHTCPITNNDNIINTFADYFPSLIHLGVCFHKLLPGHYLPAHIDKYGFYSGKFGVSDLNRIKRFVIFAEDWQPGHFLTVDKNVYSDWKAGEVVGWVGTTIHSAINIGITDRYTIQITGIEK